MFVMGQRRIQAMSGYIVPSGAEVRHHTDAYSGEPDDGIVTLMLCDAGRGGSELSLDMPASVTTEVIATLRQAIEELGEKRRPDSAGDPVPCAGPG